MSRACHVPHSVPGLETPSGDDPSPAFQELGVQAGRQGASCQARLPLGFAPDFWIVAPPC